MPAAMGPTVPLKTPLDDARDRPREEQAGIEFILATLEASEEPVVLSAVGSARVITAACNRAPDLMRSKTRAVLLNAGATAGSKREWNVGLDTAAFVGLWRSGLPIHWYPCATERSAFNRQGRARNLLEGDPCRPLQRDPGNACAPGSPTGFPEVRAVTSSARWATWARGPSGNTSSPGSATSGRPPHWSWAQAGTWRKRPKAGVSFLRTPRPAPSATRGGSIRSKPPWRMTVRSAGRPRSVPRPMPFSGVRKALPTVTP